MQQEAATLKKQIQKIKEQFLQQKVKKKKKKVLVFFLCGKCEKKILCSLIISLEQNWSRGKQQLDPISVFLKALISALLSSPHHPRFKVSSEDAVSE